MIQEKSEGEKKPLGENHLAVYKLEKDYFFLAGRPLRFAGAFALAAVLFFAVLALAFFFLAGAFLAFVAGFAFFTFFLRTFLTAAFLAVVFLAATFFTDFFATFAFLTVLRFFAGILFLPKKFSLKIQHIYFTMKTRKIKLFDHVFIVF